MFGNKISIYNAENLEQYFGKLFNTASHLQKNIQCPLLVVHSNDDILLSRQQVFELTERVNGAGCFIYPSRSTYYCKTYLSVLQPEGYAVT